MPASYSKNLSKLENALGVSFRDRELLNEALTHKSFYHESREKNISYNERLEFLGDSVLGLVVAEYLFSINPQLSEARMSKIKSLVVKEASLHDIAEEISVGSCLRLGKGEESSGGRSKKSVLADAVEAIIGAVFLDAGFDAARKTVLHLLEEKILRAASKNEGTDHKSELQELSQELFGSLPVYRIAAQEGEEHEKIFTSEVIVNGELFGSGRGRSKKESEKAAAEAALKKLRS
ncbi:MAG: ribonuclease III [Nitrospiraceae bacterium]|nr:ribonuclease III [Nitrospiraceae bacterium]